MLTGGGPGTATSFIVQYNLHHGLLPIRCRISASPRPPRLLLGSVSPGADPASALSRPATGEPIAMGRYPGIPASPPGTITDRRATGAGIGPILRAMPIWRLAFSSCFGPVVWLALSSFKDPGRPSRISADASSPRPDRGDCRRSGKAAPSLSRGPWRMARYASWPRSGASASSPRWSIRTIPKPCSRCRSRIGRRCANFASPPRNYSKPLGQFNFLRYLFNSVVVTTVATAITLLINSMAAYGLCDLRVSRGEGAILGFCHRHTDGADHHHPGFRSILW